MHYRLCRSKKANSVVGATVTGSGSDQTNGLFFPNIMQQTDVDSLSRLLPPANEVCEGYVLQVSVCPQEGACMAGGGCAWQWGHVWRGACMAGGTCVVGGVHGGGGGIHAPPPDTMATAYGQ